MPSIFYLFFLTRLIRVTSNSFQYDKIFWKLKTIFLVTMHVTISQEVSFDKNGTNMLSNFMQGNIYPKVDDSLPKFDTRIVASKLKSSSNNKLRSFFNIKYFTDSILGKTWHIILFYLVLYYMVQVLYQLIEYSFSFVPFLIERDLKPLWYVFLFYLSMWF